MPRRRFHRIKYSRDELLRNFLVEEITHRVYEDHARRTPAERLLDPLRPERQVETTFERMSGCPPEPLRETLCVAVVTSGADLCATRNWIPRGVCPFD